MLFSTGENLFFPSTERLTFLYAYRSCMLVDETANATLAPEPTPGNHGIQTNINDFNVAHAHAHEGALRKIAKYMGVTLVRELHECKGCSMEKGIPMSILFRTDNRACKRLSLVFVDLGDEST